jgi:hypothetical protein
MVNKVMLLTRIGMTGQAQVMAGRDRSSAPALADVVERLHFTLQEGIYGTADSQGDSPRTADGGQRRPPPRPHLPGTGDEPAEAGVGRRIARIT